MAGRTNTGGRRISWTAALLGGALALSTLAIGTAGAQETDGAKKVGTERIVVTPPKSPNPGGPEPEQLEDRKIQPPPAPASDPKAPLPEVHSGEEGLPPLVAKMRRRILEAAYSGEMQRLKVVMQQNEMPPALSVNEIGDPIEFLQHQSGDGKGMEILAILTTLLESDWVHLDAGKPQEMYVWPAWAAFPPDRLTPPQLVRMFKILTSSDFEEMKAVNHYTFYSVGIGPDGTWHWFKTDN
ncbi:MAG: hypothetical protein GX458_13110 [Phyllobacteriaceae bacterium]|nr:hypothetical protein [Phyllobacteriaceae bacterium]